MISKGDVPDSKAVKVEGVVLAIKSSFGVGQPVRVRDANGRGDVVKEALWKKNDKSNESKIYEMLNIYCVHRVHRR